MAHSPPPARLSGGSGIPPETNKNANQKGNTQSTTIDRRRVPMLRQGLGCWAVALSALLLPREGGTAEIKNYSPVTDQRLANPEPGNWLMYRRTHDGANYSPLNKI